MIQEMRSQFNDNFSTEKYAALLADITSDFDYLPTFRIAETPFFIPDELKNQLIEASNQVVDFIQRSDFKSITQRAIDLNTEVPNENGHAEFLAVDFGICEENGRIVPKLIEVQGFPSIFNFQFNLFQKLKAHYPFLDDFTPFFEGVDDSSYIELLRKVILNGYSESEVILLEIEPEKQNTKIDFYYCKRDLGIPFVCVTDIIKEGKRLFYLNKEGEKIHIKRIYNRVIFDELDLRKDLKLQFSFQEELDIEWAGHPNWYTRISKYILPYLQGEYFIETKLLSDLETIPTDLENYVLKPLFSFSGTGVVFHVTQEAIDAVKEKDLYILQKKVHYKPVIQAPEGEIKVEVRMLALWPKDQKRPQFVCNLARLSRGEMIGVKFNKDRDWVGGSIGLFQKEI